MRNGTFLTRVPGRGKAESRPVEDVVDFVKRRMHFEPDEAQAAVLRSDAKRVLLACSRQWGKSTVASAKAVHRAYTRPGCLVLIASPGRRQTEEFLAKIREFTEEMGVRARGHKMRVEMPNGSRIVGLPGIATRVRGFSAASLLMIDEAAYASDALYKALRPTLATTGGDVWLMSTPNGRQGFFYEAWEHGGDRWMRMAVKATECARIDKEFLEEEREEHGADWVRQEYLCEFIDNGVGLFDREVVERAMVREIEPLF